MRPVPPVKIVGFKQKSEDGEATAENKIEMLEFNCECSRC